MIENQDDKKPMDIVAEEKLKKWLKDVGLSEERKEGEAFIELSVEAMERK